MPFDFAVIAPGESVLDVGWGPERRCCPWVAAKGGIELSPAMAARARETAPAAEVGGRRCR
jgi:hypothetical protein